jgi:hypothetical protein
MRNDEPSLADRNRRTATALIGWIVGLMIVSLLVIWMRNG